jgi:carbamoyltransferase
MRILGISAFYHDAFRCFMGTEIDMLVAGNCILHKETQPAHLKIDYARQVEPD